MTSTRPKRPSRSTGKLLLICVGIGFLAGISSAVLSALGLAPDAGISFGVTLLAAGGGVWWSRRWWNAVDEGVREAHKTSWFWGGSVGMVAVVAVAVGLSAISGGDAPQFGVSPQEAGLLLTGIAFTVGMLITGYGVFWAGWWFTRSR